MNKKIVLGFFLVISSFSFAQKKPYLVGKFDSKASILSNPIEYNSNIYFGNDAGVFIALDAVSLKKRWSFKTESAIRSKPVVHEGIIYFKSGYDVYALNSVTGEEIWSYSKEFEQEATQQDYWDYHAGVPVVHNGIIYFGFEDGSICGFDLTTGDIETQFNADQQASVKSGLSVNNNILYFGDWNGKIYAYDLNKSERLWKYDTYEKQAYPTFGQINSELTIYKDLLFFGARNPEFQVINLITAQKKWNFTEKDGGWISGDPLIYEDTLFIAGSDNHKILAFDPISGNLYWEYEFLFNNFSKPLIYKDYILFTTGDAYSVYGTSHGFGYLYALDRKNGSIVNFSLVGGNLHATPVIWNEYLFLCSEDGNLYKIDIHAFLKDSCRLKQKGYRAFDLVQVDARSDSSKVKIAYKVNYETKIKVRITDLSDNEIKTLHESVKNAGAYNTVWDTTDNNKKKTKPGYYFLEISSGHSVVRTPFEIASADNPN